MSRTVFVSCGNDGFWAYDIALSILLKHMIDVAEPRASEADADWLRESVEWWRIVAGPCQGTYGLEIEQSWSETQRELFVELTRQACDRMVRRKRWSGTEVASWRTAGDESIFPRSAKFISTAPVVELGQAVIRLAERTLPEPPPRTCWFFGSPKGRDTIRWPEQA